MHMHSTYHRLLLPPLNHHHPAAAIHLPAPLPCRNHHPALDELPNLVDNFRRPSPVPDQPVEALVKQPPTQLLLGVLLDAVYPPRSGKEAFVKGQVARHILDTQMQPGDINIEDKVFNIGGAAVGECGAGTALAGVQSPHGWGSSCADRSEPTHNTVAGHRC